jgi:hypothetical protein
MSATRCGMALSIVFAAASGAVLLNSAPAGAKHGVQEIEVGPIWNQMDAERKCPQAASRAGGRWTGQWRTTRPGQMSVCEIAGGQGGGGRDRWVEAGPIWNQSDADQKCPKVARSVGGKWTGQWKTTRPGQMSVCEVKRH